MYKILLVKSKVTLVTLLRACHEAALPECAIPHTKTPSRVQIPLFPKPHECLRPCRRLFFGEPGGTFFACKAPLCACTVAVQPLCGHGVPKVGPQTPREGKRCQKGGQKGTFRSLKRHFWVPKRREWSLVKTSAGAMFSSHSEGPGPSLFAPEIDSGTHCAPEALFFTLLCPI